jgi:predicted nucleotidyltransferase
MSWSDSLFSYVVGKLTAWSDKQAALKDIKTLTWIYRYHNYDEAAFYVESIRQKYRYDLEVEDYTHKAKVYAQFYFHLR